MEKSKTIQRQKSVRGRSERFQKTSRSVGKKDRSVKGSPSPKEGRKEKSSTKKNHFLILPTMIYSGIPNAPNDRIDFIKKVLTDEDLLKYYSFAPLKPLTSYQDMAKYFTSYNNRKNDIEIYALIYYFICNNLLYDSEPKKEEEVKPDVVYKSGLGTCEGFAKLFQEMCLAAGLKCQTISGLVKGHGYKVGDSLTRHFWNVITLGKHYLVDTTFGAGYGDKKFRQYYFMTPAEFLIETHRPDIDRWQILNKTISVKEFTQRTPLGLEPFYSSLMKYNLRLLDHCYPEVITKEKTLVIKFKVDHLELQTSLECNGKEIINASQYTYDEKSDTHIIEASFAGNGEYYLNLHGRPLIKKDLPFFPLLRWKIKVCLSLGKTFENDNKRKETEDIKESESDKSKLTLMRQTSAGNLSQRRSKEKKLTKIPSVAELKAKNKCYDNLGAHLIEPKNTSLRIGSDVKFKVKVKDSLSVMVLDGTKSKPLKRRAEDIWEGNLTIQSDNLVICSLKSSNVYTEVFEFFPQKHSKI